jgi:hypothetical protein
MAKRRKEFTFVVTVTAPARVEDDPIFRPYRAVSAREVAKEIRANIAHQSMHSMDQGDIKVRRIRSAPPGFAAMPRSGARRRP